MDHASAHSRKLVSAEEVVRGAVRNHANSRPCLDGLRGREETKRDVPGGLPRPGVRGYMRLLPLGLVCDNGAGGHKLRDQALQMTNKI